MSGAIFYRNGTERLTEHRVLVSTFLLGHPDDLAAPGNFYSGIYLNSYGWNTFAPLTNGPISRRIIASQRVRGPT